MMPADDLTMSRRARVGGAERRSAERFEARLGREAKQAQRDEVAAWLLAHHGPDERARLLSLPDEHWTFESQFAARPGTTFLGVQRDWTTLERGLPWMPRPDDVPPRSEAARARPFVAATAAGDVHGYARGANAVFYVWAGSILSFDAIGSRSAGTASLRTGGLRSVTCAWLDFNGYLTREVVAAVAGLPAFLGGKRDEYPAVASFLACRDRRSSHEARVAALLVGLHDSTRGRRGGFRFRFDRFVVHPGPSPFLSVFGTFYWKVPCDSPT